MCSARTAAESMLALSSNPRTLAEAWQARVDEGSIAPPHVPPEVQARREWYAGALAAIGAIGAGADRFALVGECLDFAKTIGTPAESAAVGVKR